MISCLGGPGPNADPRTLNLEKYVESPDVLNNLPASVPAPIISGTWGMLGNSRSGDCTFAAAGHAEKVWAGPNAPTPRITTAAVLSDYSKFRTQQAAANPQGKKPPVTAVDALSYWRTAGVAGHRIDAFAQVDVAAAWVKFAMSTFKCAYVVLWPPTAVIHRHMTPAAAPAWTNVQEGEDWTLNPKNSHCVVYIAYDANTITAVTWGRTISVSWEFHADYCTELYVALSPSNPVAEIVEAEAWQGDAAAAAAAPPPAVTPRSGSE